MSTFEFIVSVDVDDWQQDVVEATDWPDRTEGEYAAAALYLASLTDADRLDGYADLMASATITQVSPL